MTIWHSFCIGVREGFVRFFMPWKWLAERRPHLNDVHSAHLRVWSALDELVNALDSMPTPPPGRLADAISCAKDARDRNLPW